MSVEHNVLKTVENDKPRTVGELVGLLRSRHSEDEVLDTIKRLEEEGKVELNQQLPDDWSLSEYMGDPDSSLWFYLLIALSLSTIATIYLPFSVFPLVIARWVLGSLFVLYLPGFALVETLFPRRSDLNDVERVALSMGLSIAVTPLIGLLLNYTPWGIRLDPVAASLSIFTLGMALLAMYRKFLLAKGEFPSTVGLALGK